MNKLRLSITLLFVVAVSIVTMAQSVQDQSAKFGRLLRLIDSYYADSTDLNSLAEKAIIHMLSELDPHSVYISKEEVDKMNEPLQGSFDGIGISFSILRDTLMVVQTIAGGPSEKVGLRAGDRIIQIDKETVAGVGLTNQMVFDRLRGEKGTKVKLSILRKEETSPIDFEITRDKIPIFSLDASYLLDKNTGYIKLNRFSATTTEEFVEAIKGLKQGNQLNNLVLDLRGNGGGFLKQAHEISDQFLEAAKMIVYTEGLKNPRKTYESTNEGEFKIGKLVVLIDEGSASASEIVSGAVQDWDRGVIVGRRSFGKGLVQQPYYLTDGSMVRLTTAHYYTPSGRCIQKPYENGSDEYRDDYRQRLSSGEFFNKDSIHVIDSLTYKTLINQRNVYGGGGVVPDIFIPMDTSVNYRYYNQISRLGIVNQYAENYIDQNRNSLLQKYTTFENFKKNYHISNDMLEELWVEAEKKEVKRDEPSIAFITDHAKRHLKARIARDLYKAGSYYEIVNEDDDAISTALKILNDNKRYNNILKGIYNE
jgi:carboxyl-terminal processing protease